MDSGSGYDSVTRTVRSSPSEQGGLLPFHPVIRSGQKVETYVQQVESIEQMHELLRIGTEIEAGYDAFSAGSIGKFLNQTRADSYSLYFVVVCYVENTEERVDKFEIDAKHLRLDDDEFRAGFGDCFVAGWVTGGYLIGLSEVRANSRQALNKVEAEIGASYKGPVSVSGKFASDWERWQHTSGITATMRVIYAGMDGAGVTGAPVTVTPPKEPVLGTGGGGTGTGGPPRDLPVLTDDDIVLVDDDDDDEEEEEEEEDQEDSGAARESRGASAARQPAVPARGTTPARPPSQPFNHASPGLGAGPEGRPDGVEMTMQNLLDAVKILPNQAKTSGVPLYAILEPYSPKYRKVGQPSIAKEAFKQKRDLVNKAYMKARRVLNSVAYALEKPQQFRTPKAELEAVRERMTTLMQECESAFHRLEADPTYKLPKTIQVPSDADIPPWVGEKTEFKPFAQPLNPVLFTRLLEEATALALQIPEKPARSLLLKYLAFVADKVVENHRHAKEVLSMIAVMFPNLDKQPASRAVNLDKLVGAVAGRKDGWQKAGAQIKSEYHMLAGKAGLDDDALKFLQHVNPPLFDADRKPELQAMGFAAFWEALHGALQDLARQQPRDGAPKVKFADTVDFGTAKNWSDQAAEFGKEAAAIGSVLRDRLAHG